MRILRSEGCVPGPCRERRDVPYRKRQFAASHGRAALPPWRGGHVRPTVGAEVSPETLLAHTTPAEVAAGGRPTLGGFEVGKVPFHVTGETQDLTAQYFGGSGLPADSMFGTLTPKVDYVR